MYINPGGEDFLYIKPGGTPPHSLVHIEKGDPGWTLDGPRMDPGWTPDWTPDGPQMYTRMDPGWTPDGPRMDPDPPFESSPKCIKSIKLKDLSPGTHLT